MGSAASSLVDPRSCRPTCPDQRGNGLRRPSAAFLAQLIAARHNLPQMRQLRRAEPHEAIAAYAAAARTT